MRFSSPAVIVAFIASMMFVSASEIPTGSGEGRTLSYDTEGRDENTGFISGREYSYDIIKGAGRFARRGALTGVSSLYKRSEIGEVGEELASGNSDGVGHR